MFSYCQLIVNHPGRLFILPLVALSLQIISVTCKPRNVPYPIPQGTLHYYAPRMCSVQLLLDVTRTRIYTTNIEIQTL